MAQLITDGRRTLSVQRIISTRVKARDARTRKLAVEDVIDIYSGKKARNSGDEIPLGINDRAPMIGALRERLLEDADKEVRLAVFGGMKSKTIFLHFCVAVHNRQFKRPWSEEEARAIVEAANAVSEILVRERKQGMPLYFDEGLNYHTQLLAVLFYCKAARDGDPEMVEAAAETLKRVSPVEGHTKAYLLKLLENLSGYFVPDRTERELVKSGQLVIKRRNASENQEAIFENLLELTQSIGFKGAVEMLSLAFEEGFRTIEFTDRMVRKAQDVLDELRIRSMRPSFE